MLIGQINNGSLGLKGQQPIENRYVSDITVTLLKWHCTVTHAHRHTPALTHTLALRLTLMSSGEVHLKRLWGRQSLEAEEANKTQLVQYIETYCMILKLNQYPLREATDRKREQERFLDFRLWDAIAVIEQNQVNECVLSESLCADQYHSTHSLSTTYT